MRRGEAVAAGLAVLVSAGLLLWPAVWNGYPLLFGDTGVYIKDGIQHHVSWPRPMFYGLFMLPLHLRITTWPVVVVQALITAFVLLAVLRSFVPRAHPLLLLPVTLVLTVGTSLPWFVSQLMPDLFAGLLVLALSTLLLVPPMIGRAAQVVLVLFAGACITFHLSLLPISFAVVVTLWLCRRLVDRGLRWPDLLRGAAPPAIAALLLVGVNAVLAGQASLSPYGKIFVLNRLLFDGPAERVLQRECPRPGWTLCDFKDEIPTLGNEDDMLWGDNSVLIRAGTHTAVAAQAWPIITEAFRAEPGTVLWQALRNTVLQFVSFRSADALQRRSAFNVGVWASEFPPAEQARYHGSRQYRRLPLLPAWLQAVHLGLGALAIIVLAVGTALAVRERRRIGGLYAAILVALLANAFVSGALSGVFDRYQSRLVWLATFAVDPHGAGPAGADPAGCLPMIAGGCSCGRVRYETDGVPFHQTICHCVDCRRAVGAASVAWFSVARASVRWTGAAPASIRSSPPVTRRFCGACGTSLSYESDEHPDEIDLTTASLDDPDAVPPADHVFVSQRLGWDAIGEGLPVYRRRRADG